MIIKRKLFSAGYNNLDTRLGFKDFRESGYKPLGPWVVDTLPFAREEYDILEKSRKNTVDKIKEHISKFPTMIGGPYRQHPLWNYYDTYKNEFVVWSADIDPKGEDRMIYLIFKGNNKIWITNLLGHRVFDQAYSNTPRTSSPVSTKSPEVKVGKDGRVIISNKQKNKKK